MVSIDERLGVEALVAVIMNFDKEGISEYDELVVALDEVDFPRRQQKKMDLDLKNRDTSPAKPSIDEPLKLELKALLSYLWYVFLGQNSTLHVLILLI
ncbi:hypothetical protein H5410_046525 [Solanum commersonii]|uniref:Uncharacterized protein n=1 Tax=Solanum commersonii TaxID=4109 RepID=A0A9J5XCG8_SOLCO|nr:hypothetical protein H5410_046525 [Solanum commersonii]